MAGGGKGVGVSLEGKGGARLGSWLGGMDWGRTEEGVEGKSRLLLFSAFWGATVAASEGTKGRLRLWELRERDGTWEEPQLPKNTRGIAKEGGGGNPRGGLHWDSIKGKGERDRRAREGGKGYNQLKSGRQQRHRKKNDCPKHKK